MKINFKEVLKVFNQKGDIKWKIYKTKSEVLYRRIANFVHTLKFYYNGDSSASLHY